MLVSMPLIKEMKEKEKKLVNDFFELIKDENNLVPYKDLEKDGIIALGAFNVERGVFRYPIITLLPFDKIRAIGGIKGLHYKMYILLDPEERGREKIKPLNPDRPDDYSVSLYSSDMKVLDIYERNKPGFFNKELIVGEFTLNPFIEKTIKIRDSEKVLPFYESNENYILRIKELDELFEKFCH